MQTPLLSVSEEADERLRESEIRPFASLRSGVLKRLRIRSTD